MQKSESKWETKIKMGEIRIITDKPTNVDYTFIDDGSLKLNATTSDQGFNGSNVYVNNNNNGLSKESKRKEEDDNHCSRDYYNRIG